MRDRKQKSWLENKTALVRDKEIESSNEGAETDTERLTRYTKNEGEKKKIR